MTVTRSNADAPVLAVEYLPALVDTLRRQYGGSVSSSEIERAARQSLTGWESARIQSFIPVLAAGKARERLRQLM